MPTETQVKTEINNFLAIAESFRKWLYVDSSNYLALEALFTAALNTDYASSVTQTLATFRSRLNAAMGDGASVLGAFFFDMGRALSLSGADLGTILEQIRIYYAENGKRIKSRGFTRGTPTMRGGNTGTGVINRLTVDEFGLPIETGFPEVLSARIIQDVSLGANKHEEVFLFEGTAPFPDRIRVTGTGISTTAPSCISGRESGAIMANCSWDVYQGAAATPDAITNWTPTTDIANFAIDTSKYYRDFEGVTAPASLKIEGNDSLYQAFTTRRFPFRDDIPYYYQVAVNRNGTGCDGNFTFQVGGVSKVVACSTMSANSWDLVKILVGQSSWYKSFKQTDAVFKVGISGGATFGLLVDDGLAAPFRRAKGTWYAPVGGATKFLLKDGADWTDSATEAIIGYFLAYYFDRGLPASSGSPTSITWADPT